MDVNDELIFAVQEGKLDRIKEVLGSSDLTSSESQRGYISLCNAITYGHKDIFEFLLQKGALVNVPDNAKCNTSELPISTIRNEDQVSNIGLFVDEGSTLFKNPESDKNSAYKTNIKKGEDTSPPVHIAMDRGYLSVDHLLNPGTNATSCTFKGREGYTPLHFACEKEDETFVKSLLKYSADVNANAKGNITPLHVAFRRQHTKHIEVLLDHGANVDAPDDDGKTVLFLAVGQVQVSTVDIILKYHPNITNVSNRKSLIHVIRAYDDQNDQAEDQEAIIKKLLQYGFTVEPKNLKNCDLLHESIDKGLLIVVEDFLKHCININSEFFKITSKSDDVEKKGFTLLHTACKGGDATIVQLLLDKGAEIDATAADGSTPLHRAVLNKHKDIVGLLLSRGANIELQDKFEYTALSYAAVAGEVDIVKMVLKRCPEINNKGNRKSILAGGGFRNSFNSTMAKQYDDIVQSLQRYGFSISPDYLHDFDLLETAIMNGHLSVVEDFLKYGEPDFVSRFASAQRCMPLHLAAKWYQKGAIKLLVHCGFDVNTKDKHGQTPIFHVVVSGGLLLNLSSKHREDIDIVCAEILTLLLLMGADPNVSDEKGKTPLHYAASCNVGMVEAAKVLISRGADVDERCNVGNTPFHNAVERDNVPLQMVFLEHIVPDFKSAMHRELLNIASMNHSSTLMELPLKLGADINSADEHGKTTLTAASKNGYKKLVISLLEHGCDVTEIMVMIRDYGDREFFHCDIKNLLKRHIVKLIVAGLKKSDVTLYIPDDNTDWLAECLRELEMMKNEYVTGSAVSVRDILTEDWTRLATYAKNEYIVKYIQYECKKKFPLYSSVMQGLIWRGTVRKSLLENSINVFRSYGGIFHALPDICVQHILNYLSDGDLRVFIQLDMSKVEYGHNNVED